MLKKNSMCMAKNYVQLKIKLVYSLFYSFSELLFIIFF